jgi:hypothetical protein
MVWKCPWLEVLQKQWTIILINKFKLKVNFDSINIIYKGNTTNKSFSLNIKSWNSLRGIKIVLELFIPAEEFSLIHVLLSSLEEIELVQ